jgi:hypothetical protein
MASYETEILKRSRDITAGSKSFGNVLKLNTFVTPTLIAIWVMVELSSGSEPIINTSTVQNKKKKLPVS